LSATVLLCQLSYTARRLWQDSNLRPSKEPSHITTGECSTPGFRDSLPPDL